MGKDNKEYIKAWLNYKFLLIKVKANYITNSGGISP